MFFLELVLIVCVFLENISLCLRCLFCWHKFSFLNFYNVGSNRPVFFLIVVISAFPSFCLLWFSLFIFSFFLFPVSCVGKLGYWFDVFLLFNISIYSYQITSKYFQLHSVSLHILWFCFHSSQSISNFPCDFCGGGKTYLLIGPTKA